MAVLQGVQPCPLDVVRAHVDYLKATPVAAIGRYIECGALSLARGIITSLEDLGSLKTEFGDLGGLEANRVHGQDKFLVRQVLGALRDPRCTDHTSLKSIEYFMDLDAKGALEPQLIVTLLFDGTDCQIKDGNKRAVAFYESRKRRGAGDSIVFPVYLVRPRALAT